MGATSPAGLIFNIMRFSLADGPGIRTTVFLKGCPLRCRWCHNPEGQSFGPSLMLFEERCRHCGDCELVCPHGVETREKIRGHSGLASRKQSLGVPHRRVPRIFSPGLTACETCGLCVEACVAEARQMAGRAMSVPEVLAEIERDVVFFDESGGGVTLSGGEPLAQPDFAEALLAACRARRIHTALDTCGAAPAEVLLRVSAEADLVLFDVKLMDSELHAAHTGAPNAAILDNLRALAAAGRPIVVRYPLIPGLNDGEAVLSELAAFLGALGLRRLDLLPYHRMGADKYKRLGLARPGDDLAEHDAAEVAGIAGMLRGKGLKVGVGGKR